eukprot:110878-Pleurochrysis_carterae.AAC.1
MHDQGASAADGCARGARVDAWALLSVVAPRMLAHGAWSAHARACARSHMGEPGGGPTCDRTRGCG